MTAPPPSLLKLESVSFAHPGNTGVIPLRDPVTLDFLGDSPEWTAGGRSVPAAFESGAQPTIRAVFSQSPGAPPQGTAMTSITPVNPNHPLEAANVILEFDPHGVSKPVDFKLLKPLPAQPGKLTVSWDWVLGQGEVAAPIRTSTHELLIGWQRPIPPYTWAWKSEPSAGPAVFPNLPWVYQPIMEWVCDWAAGLTDPKAICDAILRRLPESGLKYAGEGTNVRQMLLTKGGYCGAWYRTFQAMAGALGVLVDRRTFAVNWRDGPQDTVQWCAIVVDTPGLNESTIQEDPSQFHDVTAEPVASAPVTTSEVRRYRFWGSPGRVSDGHCINFLNYQGTWYLYDACFMREAVPLPGFRPPIPNPGRPVSVSELGAFKSAYLDRAVSYMMGSLYNNGQLIATKFPNAPDPHWRADHTLNGLTVRTAVLPGADDTITFYWLT